EEEWIMLLACDLPRARELCGLIVEAARNGGSAGDGILVTASGRKQWLAGWYRRSPLMARMDRIGNPAGSPVRDLLGGLNLLEVEDRNGFSRDIDTPEDIEAIARRKDVR
ncbi:MAG: hypothetical protein M3Y45_06555, partial [Actinomycetota bacterium]|nr:hypothetical protein [Actinomycetota bacterium]